MPLNDHNRAGTRHWILNMISISIQARQLEHLGIHESQPQCKHNLSSCNGCSPIFAFSQLLHFHILTSAMEVGEKKKLMFRKLSWLFFLSIYYDLLYCVIFQVESLLSQTYKNVMQKSILKKCSKILTDFTLKHTQTK